MFSESERCATDLTQSDWQHSARLNTHQVPGAVTTVLNCNHARRKFLLSNESYREFVDHSQLIQRQFDARQQIGAAHPSAGQGLLDAPAGDGAVVAAC